MAEIEWVKISTDIFTKNRKISQIEKMPRGDTILVIWFKLIVLAGIINDGGAIYVTEDIPYTEETLADELRRGRSDVKKALSEFQRYKMIEMDDKGIIYLCSWEKYQNVDRMADIREYNRIAKQRSRAKQKVIENVNDKSMTSQRCQNTEEEEEGDKEIHSFTHSVCARAREENKGAVENYDDLKMKYLGGTLGSGVIMMSNEQFDDLCDKLSYDEINKYLAIVRDCEFDGRRFRKKTHYQAILDMVAQDRQVKKG